MAASDASADVLTATFDRYGGVEMKANTRPAEGVLAGDLLKASWADTASPENVLPLARI